MITRTRTGVGINLNVTGGGQPIIFLHPVGLSGRVWHDHVTALADSYQVFTMDFRGHGLSEVPAAPFSLADLADDVYDVLTLAQATPAVIVGLSLGGMVAQLLAIRHPEAVRALVLADTFYKADAALQAILETRAQKVLQGGMKGVIPDTVDRWFSPDFLRFAPSRVAEMRQMLAECHPVVHAWTWRAIKELNTDAQLADIRVPTLVLVGENDVSTPPGIAKALASKIPGAQYDEVPGAGHISVWEQPVWFLSRITRFLTL